jgi:hypothetical protein
VQANDDSFAPYISSDGSIVAFTSIATNLAAATGAGEEAFTHNFSNGSTLLAGVGAGDADCGAVPQSRWAAALSGDGKHIAIGAFCAGYLYFYDRVRKTAATQNFAGTYTGSGIGGSLSDVRYTSTASVVAWVYSDARGGQSVNFFDTVAKTYASIDPPATLVYQGGLAVSADGQTVVYIGGNGRALSLAIEGGTTGQQKIYSYNRSTGRLGYVSVPLSGAKHEANGACGAPALSSDGTTAAFNCVASDIVTGDFNGKNDVFTRTIASAPAPNLQAKISIANAAVTEPTSGSTNANLSITFDRPVQFDGEIEVDFHNGTATAPADYDRTSQYVIVSAGDTSATVQVPIHSDNAVEGDETFTARMTIRAGDMALGAHRTSTVTIHDAP